MILLYTDTIPIEQFLEAMKGLAGEGYVASGCNLRYFLYTSRFLSEEEKAQLKQVWGVENVYETVIQA